MRRALLPPAPVYRNAPEDYVLWVELVNAGWRFGCVPETLYGFREHAERYSLRRAQQQSAANVGVQRPLLERCERSRDLAQPAVRAKLIRGWGILAGSAYRAGLVAEAELARQRFLKLAEGPWTGPVRAAAEHGIQAMVWGGCPWHRACMLLWLWLRRGRWQRHTHRQLVNMLPGIRLLGRFRRRLEGRARLPASDRADPHPPP